MRRRALSRFFRIPFLRSLGSSGFNLVEVMIGTAMLTTAGLAVMGLSQLANHDSLQLRATRVAMTARAQIEAALKNPAAWRQTVARNSEFNCVSAAPGCALSGAPDGAYNFVLYGPVPNEKVTYDSSDATTRLSIQGGACATGVANPDPKCPMKFLARWKPLCQVYPCQNPTLDIKVELALEFGAGGPNINAKKYEYSIVRGIDDGSVQSACQILNGTYNVATGTCYPKNAGRTCASIGRPAQIVSSVAADGNITCAPLYTGQCNAATQVMNGISSAGVAQCAPRVQPPNCPTPCIGAWGACSAACGGGTQTYGVITPATNGGPACTAPAPGATQACNVNPCPTNCVGSWSACSQPCGGGTMTYTVTTPAANGGAACPNVTGDTQACNTQACAVPVNCAGSWSACNPVTGTRTFTVTQVPQNGGTACPAPLTETCPVDCVGSWGACAGPANAQFKTYTWTTPPLNGGSIATCSYPNGMTNSAGCVNGCPTIGTYTSHAAGSCYTFVQNANGNDCLGDRGPDCAMAWIPIQNFPGGPHNHNTAACNNLGGATVTIACTIPRLGQIIQCCDSNINVGAQTGTDCLQYRCN